MSVKRCKIAITLVLMMAGFVSAETINWVAQGPKVVDSTFGFEDITAANGLWQAVTENPVYPRVNILPVKIDSDANKYLYVKMATTNRDNMIAFFSPDTDAKIYKGSAIGLTWLVKIGRAHV